MVITRLRTKHYRSLSDVEIVPSRVNVIVGPAGEGKSSLIEAVRYVLTGCNAWTDARGSGIQTQVQLGQKRAEVAVDWLGAEQHSFSRTIPCRDVRALQGRVDKVLGVSSDVVDACLATRGFLRLAEKAQRDLLATILAPDVTIYRLIQEMDRFSEGLGEWFGPRLDQAPQEGSLFAWAEIERRAAKKLRDESAQTLRARQPGSSPAPVADDEVQALRTELDQAIAQHAAAEEGARGAREVYEAQRREWATAAGEHDRAIKEAWRLDAEVEQARKKLEALPPTAGVVADLEADVEALRIQARDLAADKERVLLVLDKLGATKGACPAGQCARQAIEEATTRLKDLEKRVSTVHGAGIVAAEKLQACKQAAFARSSAEAYLAECERRRDEAEERGVALPPVPQEPTPPAGNDEAERLRKHKTEMEFALIAIQQARTAYQAWQRARQEHDSLQARLAEQQAGVDRWEAAYVALGPTGIKARLVAERIADLAAQTDALAREYFGARVAISQDPWEIRVDLGQGWLPAAQLSWSWQARLSACLQIVLARTAGFPVVAVDETGADPLVRSTLLDLCAAQADIQAFLLSTAQTVDRGTREFLRPIPDPEDEAAGVRWFWVEGGRVEQLEAARVPVEVAA